MGTSTPTEGTAHANVLRQEKAQAVGDRVELGEAWWEAEAEVTGTVQEELRSKENRKPLESLNPRKH